MEPLTAAPPEGAAPLRGAPRPDLLPRRRLRPTSGACVLLPSGARSPARRSPSRAAGPCGTARPRGRRRRVRWPPLQSHHVRHPGLRHRETRSRPAGVGAQRLSRPSAPAAGPERRPEAWSGHDSLPGAPLAGRVGVRPRLCYPLQRVGAPWAFIRGPAGLGSTAPRCVSATATSSESEHTAPSAGTEPPTASNLGPRRRASAVTAPHCHQSLDHHGQEPKGQK